MNLKSTLSPGENGLPARSPRTRGVKEISGKSSENSLLDTATNWVAASRFRLALIFAGAAIPLSLAISVALFQAVQAISGPTRYPELIAGAMSVFGGAKSGDAVLVFSFWMVLGLAAAVGYSRGSTIARRINLVPLAFVLLVFSIAFLVMVSSRGTLALVDLYSPIWMFALAQTLVVAAFAIRSVLVALARHRSSHIPIVAPATSVTVLWLAIVSLAFVPTSGLIVAARYFGIFDTENKTWLAAGMIAGSLALGTAVTVAFWAWCARGRNVCRLLALIVALLGIASLPMLLPPLLTIDGTATRIPGMLESRWLGALILIAAAIVLETGLRAWMARKTRAVGGGFSSIAIAALIVPLRVTSPLPSVGTDDYHFGELFTPAYLFLTQGMAGEIPMARGPVVNLFPQLLNVFLSSGTASTFSYVNPMYLVVILGLGHALLRYSVGTFAATVIIVAFGFSTFYTEADFAAWVVILFAADLVRRDKFSTLRGFAIGLALAGAIIIYPMMGLAGSLILGALLVFQLAGALVSRQYRQAREQSIVVLTTILVFLAIYFFDPIKGLQSSIAYVVSQAQGNLLAHGMPISSYLKVPFADSFFVTFAFGLVIVVCLWAMWHKRAWLTQPSSNSWFSFALLAFPIAVVIGLSSRFLGRVDDVVAFRALAGSLLVIALILPVCLLLADSQAFRKLALMSLGAGLAISIVASPLFPGGIQTDVVGINHGSTWATADVIDTIPALGLADADQAVLDELQGIGNVSIALSTKLTIQNLSNRNALNAYFGWPNSGDYLAPYNIPGRTTERDFVTALSTSAPQALFLGRSQWGDGLSMSLRTPLLADWAIENYLPVTCPGSQWAVRKTLAIPDSQGLFPTDCVIGSDRTNSRTLWSKSIGAPVDLQFLPYSWGSMVESFANQSAVPLVSATGADGEQMLVAELTGSESPAREYLRVDATCAGLDPISPIDFAYFRASSQASLSWTRSGSTEPNVLAKFEWGVGSFLIPLNAYPEWSLPPWSDGALTLVPPPNSCPGTWSVAAHFVEPPK
jgi:hypothetical protein